MKGDTLPESDPLRQQETFKREPADLRSDRTRPRRRNRRTIGWRFAGGGPRGSVRGSNIAQPSLTAR
jgi:hypothetical protein